MGDKNLKQKEEMDQGTYEVIKARLKKQGAELNERVNRLNEVRKEAFGSIETKLLGSDRIITEHNCIPRDMAPVGDCFLFGYNVHMGLKSKVALSDVFSVTRYGDRQFTKQTLEMIDDPEFVKDFEELYTYYKDTFFAKFTIKGSYFYMIFQTGKSPADIKVFKWEIEEDRLRYVDNRSESEVRFLNATEIPYIKATRDDQRNGAFPHVSILDQVFVETINGDLTIKVEDNTDTGKGIYSEPVEDAEQSLDDAEIYYAQLDQMILLKIKPYKEEQYRYFIFNNKLKNVIRIDAIKDNCVLLPGNHGIIFPKGYYLQTGEYKIFDVEADGAVFDERINSLNGEDFQYIFYHPVTGLYMIYSYNVIEQKIDMPIVCSGYAHFATGEMVIFRQENEPRKNHMVQIWQTPFVSKDSVGFGDSDSAVVKIGNKDIVNAMADCRGVVKLIEKKETYQSIYEDIVKECERITDSYFWLDKEEAFNLREILLNVKETAVFAIGEYEKVQRIQAAAKQAMEEVSTHSKELLSRLQYGTFDTMEEYVTVLAEIRTLRGQIAGLKDLRYINLDVVNQLDVNVREKYDEFASKCVEFLLAPEGMKPYEAKVEQHSAEIEQVTKSKDGKELEMRMDKTSGDLELLIDIISNFKIDDPTITTQIIEKISGLYSRINNSKARLVNKINDMTRDEMKTQFFSQVKLLSQSVINYLDIADTVEKCDEYLNKVMITIQELEGKFAEFDEYVLQLGEKREELYTAFESRKQAILEKQNRRVLTLFQSAERILTTMAGRLKNFQTVQEIQGYLATDIMAEKVRDIVASLNQLKDSVKADEIEAKLKKLKEDAVRQLKDRQELYLNGTDVIKLGKHHFSVNTNEIDLSIVQKDGSLYYHVTGTDFWDEVKQEGMEQFQPVLLQSVVSENEVVYRAEYLVYQIYQAAKAGELESLDALATMPDSKLLEIILHFMEPRYQESYTKGVHDQDAAKILKVLLEVRNQIDYLIYSNESRAMARLYWNFFAEEETKELITKRMNQAGKVASFFQMPAGLSNYVPLLCEQMKQNVILMKLCSGTDVNEAAEYLCMELIRGQEFVISKEAHVLYEGMMKYLREVHQETEFLEAVKRNREDVEGLYYFVQECLFAYRGVNQENEAVSEIFADDQAEQVMREVIVLLMDEEAQKGRVIYVDAKTTITGLIGNHACIQEGTYTFSYASFMHKLMEFQRDCVPAFIKFTEMKKELIRQFRKKIHLDDYKPQVLSSFVRNRLIDEVYLPLIGENLAKQIGEVGENKRTDLMGLLLLLSPPGYGKTTLMEYIASRLGIILVKINGPSLGNEVVSLDPALTNNIGAREELVKLNVALKMGNNVMIYLDDIQHCNPEFLQKFISLCDGQRKIDGVYDGVGQTYDLRGKKVAVVMAGNPYTERGEQFKIPDMLANRADVYNLGDMLSEHEEAFKLSYLENCLTSNPILSKLTSTNTNDLYGFVAMAQGEKRESVALEGTYSVDEINEYVRVIEKLMKVRDVVLKINMEYIHSATQADEYRKEPPFKLQGSYRNMNKIAEKVVPVMNEEELFARILASYEYDSQTLTKDAEANMLKWKEITGCSSKEERERYEEIKKLFVKNRNLKGDDQMGRVVQVLAGLADQIERMKEILEHGFGPKEE